MARSGTYKYVPMEILEELERVKFNFKIDKDAEAFRKIAQNSRIGRDIQFSINFNVGGKKKR